MTYPSLEARLGTIHILQARRTARQEADTDTFSR
jgi:hypothetical protein